MDSGLSNLWLLGILPVVSVVCLALNFFIRARGGRSVKLNLEGFGIKLRLETHSASEDVEETSGR